jgi:hypothetical protein
MVGNKLPSEDEVLLAVSQYKSIYIRFAESSRKVIDPGFIIQEFSSIGLFRRFIRKLGKNPMKGSARWTNVMPKELFEFENFSRYLTEYNTSGRCMLIFKITTKDDELYLPIPLK